MKPDTLPKRVIEMAADLEARAAERRSRAASCSPAWWDADDSKAVAKYREWQNTDWWPTMPPGRDAAEWHSSLEMEAANKRVDAFLTEYAGDWTCRRCLFWKSTTGITGDCKGPELQCGQTKAGDICEQWTPANTKLTGGANNPNA